MLSGGWLMHPRGTLARDAVGLLRLRWGWPRRCRAGQVLMFRSWTGESLSSVFSSVPAAQTVFASL